MEPTTGLVLEGARFKPLTPTRIVDTRIGKGTTTFKGTGNKVVVAPLSVAGPNTGALVTNTTAVGHDGATADAAGGSAPLGHGCTQDLAEPPRSLNSRMST